MYFVKRGRITLLSLNEPGEKSQATTIPSKFENKPQSNSLAHSFQKMLFIGQNLNQVQQLFYRQPTVAASAFFKCN